MKIAVAKEIDLAEPRVAASPDTVKKFKALGVEVAVEPGAGIKSGLPDSEFTAVGATVSAVALKDADIIIKVKRPEASELSQYKRGALVIAIMDPYGNDAALKAMADAGISAFAMELMPRITRHCSCGESVHHGRRRCRPAGDRNRAPAWRHRHRDRRAAGHQGAGGEPGREIPRRRG
jgi:NAD/NADP transhydrogenase alpha subunit